MRYQRGFKQVLLYLSLHNSNLLLVNASDSGCARQKLETFQRRIHWLNDRWWLKVC